jgi:hypothetical protein
VGLGVAATAIYFESQVLSVSSTLEQECPNKCRSTPQLTSQLSTVSTDRIGAGVSLGVSAVLVGAALYFFVARPLGRPEAPVSAWSVSPSVHGVTASWGVEF